MYAGLPVLTCLAALISMDVWKSRKDKPFHAKTLDELTHQDKLNLSANYVDKEWHRTLQLTDQLLEKARELFGAITDEVSEKYDPEDQPKNWRFKIASEVAADSLRILDSIYSQLMLGHPDTAQGTCRQLFELAMVLKVISLDKTGDKAKRFRDCNEMRYLQDMIEAGSSNKARHGRRIGEIKRSYPQGIDFRSTYGWTGIKRKKRKDQPGEMKDVIRYVVNGTYGDLAERNYWRQQFGKQWVTLTNWSHLTQAASMRKLGVRTREGYLREHLLEKSRTGLDTPLSIAVFWLQENLLTYALVAWDLTGIDHNPALLEMEQQIKDVAEAIEQVSSDLLANDSKLAWKATEQNLKS